MAQLPINLGVHGGISSNRIKFKDIPQAIGTQANTGYMVGAFMRVNLGKLYLEPALNYSHKRSVIEEKAQALGENPDNFDLKLNTFAIFRLCWVSKYWIYLSLNYGPSSDRYFPSGK